MRSNPTFTRRSMKFKLIFILVSILNTAIGGLLFEDNTLFASEFLQAKIIHIPVASLRENDKFVVEARVDGSSERIVFMRLYFKSKAEQSFDYIEMSGGSSGYFGEIAPSNYSGPELHYFILALLPDQSVITFPEWNPYGNPMIVSVASSGMPKDVQPEIPVPVFIDVPPTETIPEKIESLPEMTETASVDTVVQELDTPILILSPEQGEEFSVGEEVLIAASYGFTESEIDVNSINLFLDGSNVTLETEKTESVVTYSRSDFQPGKHHVLLQGYYTTGVALPPVNVSFNVKGEPIKQATDSWVRGLVFAETRHEKISNEEFSDNNVGGNISGKYGMAKFNARVFVTTRENKFYQSRNRFTFNLELPVLGFTIGDTYPRFNDLMLWGKRVRGIHGRLHLGFFNIDIIHGETVRAVTPVFKSNVFQADSLESSGVFRQKILGVRQSFGSGRNFQLGFNLLKVKDDTSSLALGQYNLPVSDYSTPPKDNLVVGSDLLIAFDNHRIELTASAALSVVSNDISGGSLTADQISEQFDVDLPIDPADYDYIIIFNSSTTPLDPRDLTSLAYNLNFRFNYFNNNIQVGYKSIGSEYVSLGNSFLRANLQGFYFMDRFRLYKNKIYVNLGYDNFNDNFARNDDNPSTRLQTINSGLSIFPGSGLPNLTFNMRSHNRDNNEDTLDIDPATLDTTDNRDNNITRDISVQLNYDVNFFQLRNSLTISYITSNRNDRFGATRLDGVNLTETSSNVELFSVRTQYQIPLTTTLNFARNENKFTGGTNNFNFNMLGAKAEYLLFNKKLQTYFGMNYTNASGVTTLTDTTQTLTDYNRLGLNAGARFEISTGHFVFIDAHFIRFNDNGGTQKTNTDPLIPNSPKFYNDRIFRLYYEKRF